MVRRDQGAGAQADVNVRFYSERLFLKAGQSLKNSVACWPLSGWLPAGAYPARTRSRSVGHCVFVLKEGLAIDEHESV